MPKFEELNIDVDELEEAEWSEDSFERYEGEVPPAGTILKGYISKMWWSKTQNDDEMLIAIFTAEENEGDLDEYNGFEAWEYLALNKGGKFRWKPFIDAFGITLTDIKGKVKLDAEDDNVGSPIVSIGKWEVGSDAAWCRVVTKREKYQGKWRGKVDKWLPYEDDEEEEEPEPEPEPTPTRRAPAGRAGKAASSRTGAAASTAGAARGTRKARAMEPVEDEADEEPEEEAPPARRGGRTAPARRTAAAAPARGGRARGRSGAAVDQEPPF